VRPGVTPERGAKAAFYAVYDVSDMAPVGWTALLDIDRTRGTCGFGILIGERRGQGLGREAARLTLDWPFHVVGVHNVALETAAWHEQAIRAYRAAGFREVGIRRCATFEWGRRADILVMDAVPDDFDSPVLAALAPGAAG
jgi:diamine N-acetyltransferase